MLQTALELLRSESTNGLSSVHFICADNACVYDCALCQFFQQLIRLCLLFRANGCYPWGTFDLWLGPRSYKTCLSLVLQTYLVVSYRSRLWLGCLDLICVSFVMLMHSLSLLTRLFTISCDWTIVGEPLRLFGRLTLAALETLAELICHLQRTQGQIQVKRVFRSTKGWLARNVPIALVVSLESRDLCLVHNWDEGRLLNRSATSCRLGTTWFGLLLFLSCRACTIDPKVLRRTLVSAPLV